MEPCVHSPVHDVFLLLFGFLILVSQALGHFPQTFPEGKGGTVPYFRSTQDKPGGGNRTRKLKKPAGGGSRLHWGWECLPLALVSHRALSKAPPQLSIPDKGDSFYSPLLSTVIQILQLLLLLSPQQLHSEVNTYQTKIKLLASRGIRIYTTQKMLGVGRTKDTEKWALVRKTSHFVLSV